MFSPVFRVVVNSYGFFHNGSCYLDKSWKLINSWNDMAISVMHIHRWMSGGGGVRSHLILLLWRPSRSPHLCGVQHPTMTLEIHLRYSQTLLFSYTSYVELFSYLTFTFFNRESIKHVFLFQFYWIHYPALLYNTFLNFSMKYLDFTDH